MEPESSRCEEEPPSLFWGLDPVFLAFAKLYIRDILDLKESRQVRGIFFYKGHPIRQVDILGTVVGVRERDAFYAYGVDDSTGVINCICWKKLNSPEFLPAEPAPSTRSLTSELAKLRKTIEERSKLEIGDVIRVRGYIQTYREEREIRALVYYKVDDPMFRTQIARMQELPPLYRQVYDQPFHCAALEKEKTQSDPSSLDLLSLTGLLSDKIKEFLLEKHVITFYQQELELEPSLLSLANQPAIHSACSEQGDHTTNTTSKAIHGIFKNAIHLLQEKGFVFQKDGDFDNLYYVTRGDKELHREIQRIIQEDCQKPNHMEKGCHFRHILACARLRIHPGLAEAVLLRVLEFLESQSDIVSASDHHYVAF
ncbi:CST complex subunit STN1 isoform X1 [Sorex araneus]|uniref:CST complex subunit STN1 isoform X1 n=1 Tax=Sorex araneus TaxID=42254 RepID=UPI002433B4DF|nr:CST complex subunit STN1 isoform X1 [Sorex araneus]